MEVLRQQQTIYTVVGDQDVRRGRKIKFNKLTP